MNIKEIAKLANVSVSTVSKIINNKDRNISADTRQRVLKIVKDYHYTPYAGIPDKSGQKTFLIGIALDASQNHDTLGARLVEEARKNGYSTLVCRSATPEEELKNLSVLCGYGMDGFLWDKIEGSLPESEDILRKKGIPCRKMDFFSPCTLDNACIDYRLLGRAAARHLLGKKHTTLFCVAERRGYLEECFFQGFQMAFLENNLPVDQGMFCILEENDGEIPARFLFDNTGAVCFSEKLAAELYELSARKNRRIPKYLSVIALKDSRLSCFQPRLTSLSLPYSDLAHYICYRLTADMEEKRAVEAPFSTRCELLDGESTDVPLTRRKQRIVVVGAINMDTLFSLNAFPKMGETTLARSITVLPGGKGLNQAVGVSRLGAEAYLIGKVGKDYEGSELFDYLKSNEISTEGVSHTSKAGTGHAYVHIQSDGESGIVIYNGANGTLTSQDISQNIAAFQHASFCLLQTEIDAEAVEYAARVAYNEKVRILLKPAAIATLSDELIQKVFLFLPNEKEIDRLCPFERTYEGKADYFLKKGAKNVIITLGHKGCYWSNGKNSRYFEAAKVNVVDTTGAADAFASALAVYLTRDYPMETAIRYATFAAGFSTTKWGVPPALIDRTTLEFYMTSGETTTEMMGISGAADTSH